MGMGTHREKFIQLLKNWPVIIVDDEMAQPNTLRLVELSLVAHVE